MPSLVAKFSKESHTTSATDQKVEAKLNVRDLEALQEGFSYPGKGYDDKLSLSKEQFVEALSLILNRGTRQEYGELFDKIDITGDGFVDWDKFASHLLLEFYEKDDRIKILSVPQWKELKSLCSPHKDVIQKMIFMRNFSRYLTVSKEGLIAMWGLDMKLQKTARVSTDACRSRDLWVMDYALMPNINKIAIAYTSKEIAFCNISIKLEATCVTKLVDLINTPICMNHWYNPDDLNESVLAWGDVGGFLNVLFWSQAAIALFERPSNMVSEKEETAFNVSLNDIIQKTCTTASYLRFKVHSDWVRQVSYIPTLDAFITCATVWNSSLVISWLEKQPMISSTQRGPAKRQEARIISRSSVFTVHQGINAFDYDEDHNQIATAGVNYHVCLWNPYVISKPNGLLRGHMAPVVAVQFHRSKGRLLSFSRDRVLRIWDVQLQVCLQRITGVFPKVVGDEVTASRKQVFTRILFHEEKLRLFLTFNNSITMLEMKVKIRDRVFSHEKPVVGIVFNTIFNQIVSACQGGTISYWLVDTGQRVKNIARSHGEAELTCLVQDPTETRLYTGSTDGTIKIWDMNGYCHHTLICFGGAHAEVGQVVILKRAVIVMGSSNHFTVFRTTNFRDHYVYPSEWKGGPEHSDDVLTGVALPPNGLITGSYDGELVVWNTNSELAARRMTQRCKRMSNEESAAKNMPYTFTSIHFLFNISRLVLLSTRKHISSGSQKGANIVSCGGNGVVRFWNAYACILVGEFAAHPNASSIIMNVDPSNEYLATGDVEGLVKVWNIKDYCMTEGEYEVKEPPELLSQWFAHVDLISGLALCTRFERRIFLVTSSTDCAINLWTLDGVKIGVFGQELRWKLDQIQRDIGAVSLASTETLPTQGAIETLLETAQAPEPKEGEDSTKSCSTPPPEFRVDNIEPFTENASLTETCNILSSYRVSAWSHTILGKEYQEMRLCKRQRKQPQTIPDLPYLHGERFGRPNYGPYYSLQLSSFDPVVELEQPDFMEHPEYYFTDRDEYVAISRGAEQAAMAASTGTNTHGQHNVFDESEPKNKFDEASLFPGYVLQFDEQMKRVNQFVLGRTSRRPKTDDTFENTIPDISDKTSRIFHSRSTLLPPIHGTTKGISTIKGVSTDISVRTADDTIRALSPMSRETTDGNVSRRSSFGHSIA
ncbi:WD repeat-containing protein 49 [Fasciola hepatica]|uniref:WD repeat-containing protein 49 n=1 Tax=Fasciola hepatica TaxID=6192 RepID=A0A4E0S1B1_FASHE|nr:WD repeat-containing protein 49 [Fasciola hepatica]